MVRGRKSDIPGAPSDWMVSGHLDDWPELAVDYVDGRLDAAKTSAIDTHLDECPECAARIAQQLHAIALLAGSGLSAPPSDLEAQVLEAVRTAPAPAKAAFFSRRRVPGQARPKPRALPVGPWLPGLAGAAAVVALVLALTISNNTTTLEGTLTTVAVAFTPEAGTVQTVRDDGAGQSATTAASLVVSSDATVGSDAATDATDAAGITLAALQPAGPLVEDEAAMASGLAAADSTAFFVFDTADGGLITQQQADAVASSLTKATGLQLMDQSLSADVRAFAAFVPREDSSAVVHLLCTISGNLDLSVCLSLEPGPEVTTWAAGMIPDERALAELSATPATPSGWLYTTSTAPTTTEGTATTVTSTILDQADTHVLVVIFMAVEN